MDSSESVRQGVDKAVRRAMEEAQIQGMEDALETNKNVQDLLEKMCVRGEAGGAACAQVWWEKTWGHSARERRHCSWPLS